MSTLKINLLVMAVALVLSAGFVFGLLVPGLTELKQCHAEIATLQSDVRKDQKKLGDVSRLYASILEMDDEMRDFRAQLPVERRFGQFLNDLSENLEACSISNYVVQPKPARKVEGEDLPDEFKLAEGTRILEVSISFSGGFDQLFNFLDGISSLPRLSHVESMKVVNDEKHPGRVDVEMIVHAYHQPD
jgi:Tfp pilus assembly protein PilO